MEAFSLLKYWRGGGLVASNPPSLNATSAAATVLSAVVESHDDDDGPFFDLEFSPHDTNDSSTSGDDEDSDDVAVAPVLEAEEDNEDDDDVEEGEEEGEFNFAVSSGSSNDRTDQKLTMSPTDDLFFKGKLVTIESDVFNSAEPNSKALFSGTLLKSATKFRVFMSGLKKSKSIINDPKNTGGSQTEQLEPVEEKRQEATTKLRRVSTAKLFKVEEVPIVSLFTRDNSSRISAKSLTGQRSQVISDEAVEASTEEKRFSKEVVQKYLKMVKPLYVSVSKRKTNRPETLSGQLIFPAEGEAVVTDTTAAVERSTSNNNVRGSLMKQGNIPAGLRVVCKHLGKSRSASSAVAAVPPGTVTSQRRDDSLLQQQDGIQSAILHCKRSFNASRDSVLSRSESDSSPSDE